MRFLVCVSELVPCPQEDQIWTSVVDLIDPELLGITPAIVAKVMLWGFGFVFGAFLMGYAISVAIGMIRKL